MAPGAGSARQKPQPPEAEPSLIADRSKIDPALEDKIRARAHEIWLSHDGQGGSAEADWLRAEEEILNQTKK